MVLLAVSQLTFSNKGNETWEYFWSNYLKPFRKGLFFFSFLSFNSSRLQFTSTGFRHARTKSHQEHYESTFSLQTWNVFAYHTTRLLPMLRAEMKAALGVTIQIWRPQRQRVGAVSLEQELLLWNLLREGGLKTSAEETNAAEGAAGTAAPAGSLRCNCFPAARLWDWQRACCSHSHVCYMISCSAACGCLGKWLATRGSAILKTREAPCLKIVIICYYTRPTKKSDRFATSKWFGFRIKANNFWQ